MALNDQTKHLLLYGGLGAAGLAVVVFAVRRPSATAMASGGLGTVAAVPASAYAAQVQALAQERTVESNNAIAASKNVSDALLSYEAEKNSLQLGLAQLSANTEIAKLNATDALTLGRLQLAANEQMANAALASNERLQANQQAVQAQLGNAALSKVPNPQGGSFWNWLGSFINNNASSFLSMFGLGAPAGG